MNVYVVVNEGENLDNPIEGVFWTLDGADKYWQMLKDQGCEATIYPAHIEPLIALVDSYYRFRNLKEPNLDEAFRWMVSEVGEMAGALNQCLTEGWVRNHSHDDDDPVVEGGDVLMMLTKTMQRLDADPIGAMVRKWMEKGWKQE